MVMRASVHGVGHQAGASRARGLGGVEFVDEAAEIHHCAVDADLSNPLAPALVPANPPMPRRAPAPAWLVLGVGPFCQNAQVRARVVEPVPIDVVAFEPITGHKSEHVAMQHDSSLLLALLNGALRIAAVQVPPPLTGPDGISGVNGGVGLDATVTSAKREGGSQAVSVEDGGRWRIGTIGSTPTAARAMQPSAYSDIVRSREEVCAALSADARYGTLTVHRTLHRSGATPRACCERQAPGHSCAQSVPDLEGISCQILA